MLRNYKLGALFAAASILFAIGAHAGPAKDHSFGEPGNPEDAVRKVLVEAHDADGEMKFIHEPLDIRFGETITFVVTNKGAMPHEFALGDSPTQRAHALMMEKMPDMKHHDDPSAITLEPGETKSITWTFNKPIQGYIEFACQMPGHYAGGMFSKVRLVE